MKKLKNRRPAIVLIVLGLILVFPGCHKEEVVQEREYPRLHLSEEFTQTDSSVSFNAHVFHLTGEILDKGFVWSEGLFPPIESSSHISSGPGSESIFLSCNAAFDFVEGTEYKVHAYAVTPEKVIYGNAVHIVSKYTYSDFSLEGFSPARGISNDTLVISGTNLSYHVENMKIQFNGYSSKILQGSDSSIQLIVPFIGGTHKAKIDVSIHGNQQSFDDFYIYDEIDHFDLDAFSPLVTGRNDQDTLTLSGRFPIQYRDVIEVLFIRRDGRSYYNLIPPIINISDTTITVSMPKDPWGYDRHISVGVNGFWKTFDATLEVS